MAGATTVKASISPHQLAKLISLPFSAAAWGAKKAGLGGTSGQQGGKSTADKVYSGVRGFFDQGYHDYGAVGGAAARSEELRRAFMGQTLLKPRAPISRNPFAQVDEISQRNMAGMEVYSRYATQGTVANQRTLHNAAKFYYDVNRDRRAQLNKNALAIFENAGPVIIRKAYVGDYPDTNGIPNWSVNNRPLRGPLIETEAGAKRTEGELWKNRAGQEYYYWTQMPGSPTHPDTKNDNLGGKDPYAAFQNPPVDPFPPGAHGEEALVNDPEHDRILDEFRKMTSPDPIKKTDPVGETQTAPSSTPTGPKIPIDSASKTPFIPLEEITPDTPLTPMPKVSPLTPEVEDGPKPPLRMPDFLGGTSTDTDGMDYTQLVLARYKEQREREAPQNLSLYPQYAQVGVSPIPQSARAGISKYHLEHLENLDQNAEQYMYREKLPDQFADHAQEYKTYYKIAEELRTQLENPRSSVSREVNEHLGALVQQKAYAATQHATTKNSRDLIYEREISQRVPGAWTRWQEKNEEVSYWLNLHSQLGSRIDGGEPINTVFAGMQDRYLTERPEKGWVTKEGNVRIPSRSALSLDTTEEKHIDFKTGDEYLVTKGYFIDPKDGSQQYGIIGARPSSVQSKSPALWDAKELSKQLDQLEGAKQLYDKVSTNHGLLVRSLGDLSRKQESGHLDVAGQIQQWVKFQQTTAWTHAAEGGGGQFVNFILTGGNFPPFTRTPVEEQYFKSFTALLTDIRNMMEEARISNEDATRVMTALGDPHATKVSLLQEQVQGTLEYLSAKIWLGIGRQVANLSNPAEAEARANGLMELYGVPKYPLFLFPGRDEDYRDKGANGRTFRAKLKQARDRQDQWQIGGRLREEPRPHWGNSQDTYRDGYLYNDSDPFLDPGPYANRIVDAFRIKTDRRMSGRTIEEQKDYIFRSPEAERE